MKKKLIAFITALVCVISCAVAFTACDSTHKHSWSADWQSDEMHHWHNCTAEGCTVTDNAQKDGYGAHDFTNGNCICGKEKPLVEVTEVLLNKTDITLEIDGEVTLSASVTPDNATNKTVTWESDKENIATVDNNGKVKAIAQGTAIITATADGKSVTCTITVTEKIIAVTGKVFVYKAGSAHFILPDGTTQYDDAMDKNKNGETVKFIETENEITVVYGNLSSEDTITYTATRKNNTFVHIVGEKTSDVDYSITIALTVLENKLAVFVTYGYDVGAPGSSELEYEFSTN